MNERIYSEALTQAIAAGKKPDAALSRLKEILKERGHSALYPKILAATLTRLERKTEEGTLEVIVAKEGDEKHFKTAITALKDSLGAERTDVRVDETIVGGFIGRTSTTEVDQSYKTALMNLYRSLTA